MICSKCKSDYQYGNFCSNCGEKLRKKCICGKMEPINRKVCFTKLEEAEMELAKFIKNQKTRWQNRLEYMSFSAMIILTIVLGVVMICFPEELFQKIIDFHPMAFQILLLLCIISILVIGIVLRNLAWRLKKRLEQKSYREFLEKFPRYAELLKKAEEK